MHFIITPHLQSIQAETRGLSNGQEIVLHVSLPFSELSGVHSLKRRPSFVG